MSSRARRRREEEERRREESFLRSAAGDDPDGPASPFGPMPFGGLFDTLFGGGLGGSWGRSYTYDFETGRWVEVGGEEPQPEPDAVPADGAPNAERPPAQPRQPQRSQRAQRP